MEGCVAIYSDLGASFQCLVITSARAYSACSDLRPISWKYIVRPRLLTDEAVNKMMCCCCGKPNLCFSFLRRFRSNEPIYLAKNRFQTNLDSKHLFVVIFTLNPFTNNQICTKFNVRVDLVVYVPAFIVLLWTLQVFGSVKFFHGFILFRVWRVDWTWF